MVANNGWINEITIQSEGNNRRGGLANGEFESIAWLKTRVVHVGEFNPLKGRGVFEPLKGLGVLKAMEIKEKKCSEWNEYERRNIKTKYSNIFSIALNIRSTFSRFTNTE